MNLKKIKWQKISVQGNNENNIDDALEYVMELLGGWIHRIDQNVATEMKHHQDAAWPYEFCHEYRSCTCYIPDIEKKIKWTFLGDGGE